jgi:hypothetical protein
MKKQVKNAALGTVNVVLTPIHLGVTLTGNIVKSTTDFVANKLAQAEGYVVHKIDNTQSVKDVEFRRQMYTNLMIHNAELFMEDKIKVLEDYARRSKKQIKEAVAEIETATGLSTLEENMEQNMLFQIHNLEDNVKKLQEQRNKVRASKKYSFSEIGSKCRKIDAEIKAIVQDIVSLRSKLGGIITATPDQAF